ncbi:uncharacterized protein [Aegilops tauschii subsp. strangulata]|uniref:uncharacterized protein isoform X2 n=1 Tax=Aegilops tauschii subsp. strangulata TaxID=200361 RepID=UPI003CC85807
MRPHTRSEFGFSVAGKRKRSPEFPCVSRFRQRRLISFRGHHNFNRTVDVLVTQTDVFLCLRHLAELVDAGSWDEAIDYLSRFLPSDRPLGVHGPRPPPLPPRAQGHRRRARRSPGGPLRHHRPRPVHHPPPHQEPRRHQAPCRLLLPPLLQEIQAYMWAPLSTTATG